MQELNLSIAFLAGLVTFLSPCVLPIMPGFLAYLAGTSLSDSQGRRMEIFVNSLLFVLGFSLVFAVLGVLLNTLLEAVAYDARTWLARIGGAIIIFFGLYLTGLIRIPWLDREHKMDVKNAFNSRYVTSFLFGAAFAAGWTPCVGAVLGSILGLAVTQPGSAFWLLLAYSLGLGIPFLVLGIFTSQAADVIRRYARVLVYIRIIFGVLLIIIGIFAFTENLSMIANFEFINRWVLGK